MAHFHDVRFPLAVGFGATGGPERRTEIVTLGSGREQRNQRWFASRRRYDAGTGIKTNDDLATVLAFFEEQRGRLYGFRYRDPIDHKSCRPSANPAAGDQLLGIGDGTRTTFDLVKRYGDAHDPYERAITMPVRASLKVEVGGVTRVIDADFALSGGTVTFAPSMVPPAGAEVRAGFEFDVPVRFDTDVLSIDFSRFAAGEIPSVPMVEILP